MKRLVLMAPLYVLLAAASCPGPEPWDCVQQEAALAGRAANQPAPFYKVRDEKAGRYIVTLRAAVAGRASGLSAQQVEATLTSVAQSYGARDIAAFTSLAQFSAEMTREQLRRLRRDSRVLFVEQDGRKAVSPIPAVDAASWGLDRIDQRDLPLDGDFDAGNSGAGIHAYIIDTGVDRDHPEFEDRLGESYNAVGDSLDDDNGHGTHVAGTVAGKTYGVAREAVVHAVRVLRDGSGTDSDVIQGIDWATQHAQAGGWRSVANMSLGGDTSRSLDTAVCRSIEAGMLHVVAAGNDDSNACGGSPAHVLQALTVGATDRPDRRASFSNRGECVDIFAPGVAIKSAWRGGGSNVISGTSMASPHGAGVGVLWRERRPDASVLETKGLIESAATPGKVTDPGDGPNRLLYAREE